MNMPTIHTHCMYTHTETHTAINKKYNKIMKLMSFIRLYDYRVEFVGRTRGIFPVAPQLRKMPLPCQPSTKYKYPERRGVLGAPPCMMGRDGPNLVWAVPECNSHVGLVMVPLKEQN